MPLNVSGTNRSTGFGPYMDWHIPAAQLVSLPSSQLGVWTQAGTTHSDICSIASTAFRFDFHSLVAEVWGTATAGTLSITVNYGGTVPAIVFSATAVGPQISTIYPSGTYATNALNASVYTSAASTSGWAQSSGGIWITMYTYY